MCTKPCRFAFRHPWAQPTPRCAISEAGHLKRLEHACLLCALQPEAELVAEAERVRAASRCHAACEFPELHPGEHAPCDLVAGHDARGALLFHLCPACAKRGVDDCIEAARSAKERVRGSLTDATAAPPAEENEMSPRKPRAQATAAESPPRAAVAAAPADAIEHVPIDDLYEHPQNTRRRFVQSEIDELAASMREVGVVQALVVRSRAAGGKEIVCGAKRVRAARIAELPTVPCIVRELSDEQTLVFMLAENKHRSGVHPLEEAEGFGRLRDEYRRTAEEIAAQTATPLRTVYQRLRFLGLGEAARAAFYEDRITARVALLLAAIPDPTEQENALADVLPREDGYTKTFEQCRSAIESRFWRDLSEAPWALDDAKLDAKAGPCTTCPYRTGHQPHLFDGAEQSDQCTKPACFDVKRAKWGMARLESARESGMQVFEGKAADAIFPHSNHDPSYDSGWTTLDGWPSGLGLRQDLRNKAWREVFAGAAPLPTAVAVVPATQQVIELHKREDLAAEAQRRGLADEAKVQTVKRESAAERKARIADEKRREARDEAQRRAVGGVIDAIQNGDVEVAVASAVARKVLDPTHYRGGFDLAVPFGFEEVFLEKLGPTPPQRKKETAGDALHRAAEQWGALELLSLVAVIVAVDGGDRDVEDALIDGDIASACGLTLRDFLPPAEDEEAAADAEDAPPRRKKGKRGKAAAAGDDE